VKLVAELSANHLGSLDRAKDIVRAAADAGADAVKLQTFTPEQMVASDLVIEAGPWSGSLAIELYRQAHTPREWHEPLFDLARRLGIEIFSSAFHPDDVDFLEQLGCPRYKIASFELTDLDLIKHVALTRKPIIMSTGMATFAEIQVAVLAATASPDITLLKCTSAYPADASDANLATGPSMAGCWRRTRWGLSDHSMGIGVAVAAAALGASMIEKHLTLRRADGGPDASFSMQPEEFEQLVTECRRAAAAVGQVRYGPTPTEQAHVALRRRSGGKRGEAA
jgi:sialic acid synthase SpsE